MRWRVVKLETWVLISAVTGLPACAVDDRRLTTVRSSADMGGAGSAGAGGAGCGADQVCDSTDVSDSGVAAADSGTVLPCSSVGLCPDLNNDNILDDTETLVQNSTFDTNIDGWNPEPGIGLGWTKVDACGSCDFRFSFRDEFICWYFPGSPRQR